MFPWRGEAFGTIQTSCFECASRLVRFYFSHKIVTVQIRSLMEGLLAGHLYVWARLLPHVAVSGVHGWVTASFHSWRCCAQRARGCSHCMLLHTDVEMPSAHLAPCHPRDTPSLILLPQVFSWFHLQNHGCYCHWISMKELFEERGLGS